MFCVCWDTGHFYWRQFFILRAILWISLKYFLNLAASRLIKFWYLGEFVSRNLKDMCLFKAHNAYAIDEIPGSVCWPKINPILAHRQLLALTERKIRLALVSIF